MPTLESKPESGTCERMAQLYASGLGHPRLTIATFAGGDDAALTRPAIAPSLLTFPERANARGGRLLVQAMTAHAVAHLRYSASGRQVGRRPPLLIAMLSLVEDARVEKL